MSVVAASDRWQSLYPLVRVAAALALLTSGGTAMYLAIVALKPVALEFGASRAAASLPYTVFMLGFGSGGILMGWVTDRIGIVAPTMFGSLSMVAGFTLAAQAESLFVFCLANGVLLGLLGASSVFAPLVADISHWFQKRRGMAVAVVICGSYVAGAIWPPVAQHYFDTIGWRATYQGFAWFCLFVMLPLTLLLLPRPPRDHSHPISESGVAGAARPLGLPRAGLQCLLCAAGVGCCVAMAVPQVHIVAYASDLGFDAADGARMLAVMLGCGIISRLASGWLSDRIGGLKTLLLGSVLQGSAIALFIPFDGLTALYLIAALFGLSQGGIVPSYAIIVRSYFPASEAGWRIGTTLLFTMIGMALGAWLAGLSFDITGSYAAAFLMAIAFNAFNALIALWLLLRDRHRRHAAPAPGVALTTLPG